MGAHTSTPLPGPVCGRRGNKQLLGVEETHRSRRRAGALIGLEESADAFLDLPVRVQHHPVLRVVGEADRQP
jgi:hypothetical protein